MYVYIECFTKSGKKVSGQGEYSVGTVAPNQNKDFSCTFTVTKDASKIVYYNIGAYNHKNAWGDWVVE